MNLQEKAEKTLDRPETGELLNFVGRLSRNVPFQDKAKKQGLMMAMRTRLLQEFDCSLALNAAQSSGLKKFNNGLNRMAGGSEDTPLLSPSLVNGLEGVASLMEGLEPEKRAAWAEQWINDIAKRKLGEAQVLLYQPFAKHLSEHQVESMARAAQKAAGGLAMLASVAATSPNPKVATPAQNALVLWNGPKAT